MLIFLQAYDFSRFVSWPQYLHRPPHAGIIIQLFRRMMANLDTLFMPASYREREASLQTRMNWFLVLTKDLSGTPGLPEKSIAYCKSVLFCSDNKSEFRFSLK